MMTNRVQCLQAGRLRVLIPILGVLAIVIVTGAVAVSQGRAADSGTEQQLAAVRAVIDRWNKAEANLWCVPSTAIDAVQEHLGELAADEAVKPADGESAPIAILPAAAAKEMQEKYAAEMNACLTNRYAEDMRTPEERVAEVNLALYNNPEGPVVVDEPTVTQWVEIKKYSDDNCIAWAVRWSGEVTTAGSRTQAWSLHEYRLLRESGEWRIDSDISLGCVPALYDEAGSMTSGWGPEGGHGSWRSGGEFAPRYSELYPDGIIPQSELERLDEIVP